VFAVFSVANDIKLAVCPSRDTYRLAKGDFPLSPTFILRIRRTEIGCGSDDDNMMILIDDDRIN
jgi:hypothetical protein